MKIEKISGFMGIALFLVIWEVISLSGLVNQLFFPSLVLIAIKFYNIIITGEIFTDLAFSVYRIILGFTIAAILAVSVGILLGSYKKLFKTFEPLIELFRPIPSAAIIPIAILFFGIGDVMKIFVIIYASLWPILINTIEGIKNTDLIQIETGKVFGLTEREIMTKIKFPNALPYIVAGLRISLAISLILTITVEMIAGSNGLGHFIISSQRWFMVPEMYAGVIIIGLLGYILNKVFTYYEQKYLRWHKILVKRI